MIVDVGLAPPSPGPEGPPRSKWALHALRRMLRVSPPGSGVQEEVRVGFASMREAGSKQGEEQASGRTMWSRSIWSHELV